MSGYRDLSPCDLRRLQEDLRVIDVREAHEFHGELGHLDDAELVPLATLERAAGSWDRRAPILLVCRSGGRSSRAALLLAGLGFERIYNLAGGMLGVRQQERVPC